LIISHKHKFIFIKTRKTAGTSIEISLSRFCGKNDIITPITPEDEKIRKEFLIGPQNYQLHKSGKIFFKIKSIIYKNKIKNEFYNHAPGIEIKKEIGEEVWNSYYKFCFDRNPWDKTISLYWWDKRLSRARNLGFDEWFESRKKIGLTHYNYPLYSDNNDKILVDFVGKYENLETDLLKICNKIGIEFDNWLPKAKGGFRKDKKHYSCYFNEEQKEFINKYFKKEIELMNYSFDS